MPRGGKREGAGRPAGALTQKTRDIAEQAIGDGVTPLEVMLSAMRFHYAVAESEMAKPEGISAKLIDDALEAACTAARDAAPYIHPKLSAVTMDANIGMSYEDALLELKRRGTSGTKPPNE